MDMKQRLITKQLQIARSERKKRLFECRIRAELRELHGIFATMPPKKLSVWGKLMQLLTPTKKGPA